MSPAALSLCRLYNRRPTDASRFYYEPVVVWLWLSSFVHSQSRPTSSRHVRANSKQCFAVSAEKKERSYEYYEYAVLDINYTFRENNQRCEAQRLQAQ